MLSTYTCPDGSHLDSRNTPGFTRRIAELVVLASHAKNGGHMKLQGQCRTTYMGADGVDPLSKQPATLLARSVAGVALLY